MQNSSLYYVKEVLNSADSDWQTLLKISKETTPFLRDDYLGVLGFVSDKYLVYRKEKPYMGICIPINTKTGESEMMVPFAPYQGLLYINNAYNYTDLHNNLEATDVLLDYLYNSRRYKNICFSNSYRVKDVRSVQWHNYHNKKAGIYSISIRYSAILNIDSHSTQLFSENRKRDIKKAINSGIICKKEYDICSFLRLYESTFFRQGIMVSEKEVEVVKKLIEIIVEKEIGEMWYALDDMGRYIDGTVFLYHNDVGYYLFGANDPNQRKKGGSSLLFADQIKKMCDQKIKCLDFVGVNSPYRGDFKLSFGSVLMPYYLCSVRYCC